jgi:hypothetical protein
MDSFQKYFKYEWSVICGIPSITLEGTIDDWKLIRSRIDGLDYMLMDDLVTQWLPSLRTVIDHFVSAASGDADQSFWQRFVIARNPGSLLCGGPSGPLIGGNMTIPLIQLTYCPFE